MYLREHDIPCLIRCHRPIVFLLFVTALLVNCAHGKLVGSFRSKTQINNVLIKDNKVTSIYITVEYVISTII